MVAHGNPNRTPTTSPITGPRPGPHRATPTSDRVGCLRQSDLPRLCRCRHNLDHGLTGTNRRRPGLDQALAAVRAGDTLVVPKLDRLARSVPDARPSGRSSHCGGSPVHPGIRRGIGAVQRCAVGHIPRPWMAYRAGRG
ncbi:MAG: recombinase family protein [Sciscionella sp.]